jgi:hypothetical protein
VAQVPGIFVAAVITVPIVAVLVVARVSAGPMALKLVAFGPPSAETPNSICFFCMDPGS